LAKNSSGFSFSVTSTGMPAMLAGQPFDDTPSMVGLAPSRVQET
jgi:hypothetical protein